MRLLARVTIAVATGVAGYMLIRVAKEIGIIVLCVIIACSCLPDVEKGSAMGRNSTCVSQWSLGCASISCTG